MILSLLRRMFCGGWTNSRCSFGGKQSSGLKEKARSGRCVVQT